MDDPYKRVFNISSNKDADPLNVRSNDLLDILRKYKGDIAPAVCFVCVEINGWDREIDTILEREDQRWQNRAKGFPANDPIWDRYKALWKKHEAYCLVFSYDDWSFAICKDHLNTAINLLNA